MIISSNFPIHACFFPPIVVCSHILSVQSSWNTGHLDWILSIFYLFPPLPPNTRDSVTVYSTIAMAFCADWWVFSYVITWTTDSTPLSESQMSVDARPPVGGLTLRLNCQFSFSMGLTALLCSSALHTYLHASKDYGPMYMCVSLS